ncbi:MAG: creatinine amidohydrolase [Leifsonia sp.]|nr:creatinine amidohydrolase [Leifsonia sp.]MBR20854.1 creatinine amidohydrolase [Leifsonia sp.]
MTRLLAELSGPATAQVLTPESILVIPTGAVEHHGPHLPLITDTLLAESAATAVVARAVEAGLDVWQLPTLAITKSDEHNWASGTLWLRPETLFATIVDIGRSLLTTPARKVVFMNGHGGNVALLNVALRELRRQFDLVPFFMPAFEARPGDGTGDAPDELGLGIHGGFAETALVMHLRPDLVDETAFARNVPEHIAGFRHIGFNRMHVSFGWMSNDFGPSGVIGDPTGATAAVGAEIFERSVRTGVEALAEIDRFTYRAP